jgi:hypothetical protein
MQARISTFVIHSNPSARITAWIKIVAYYPSALPGLVGTIEHILVCSTIGVPPESIVKKANLDSRKIFNN